MIEHLTFAFKLIVVKCIFIFLFCNNLYAQKIIIKGRVITDSGKSLPDCYIKISSKKYERVIRYFATGKDDFFSIEVPFSGPDSLFISASHISYRYTVVTKYITRPDTIPILLVMPLLPDTLNNVAINAPPVWVKGDTTFFNADSFKQGDEHKLKDLITRMPDFELDKQGNLLYKKQKVDKIMIEGEQLFTDKVKLMLDNFPVYVIKNVEVIKNQTDDPLLKGLINDNKLFVNLSLTQKSKLKTAFGQGEAGIGTANQYFINPVVFSIYGKTKMAYIGNWNSIGNGIGWKQEDELKSVPVHTAEKWMMQSDQLQTVNDIENRRYINNGQADSRFQINIPFSKKLKGTTEIDFIKDRQKQFTYNYSSLYNGAGFIKQTDTSRIRNDPYSLLLRQNINWSLGSDKNLTAQVSLYHNGNKSLSDVIYNRAGIASNVQNFISNRWNSYLFSLSYTHRVSAKRAVKWFADLSQHNYPQKVSNISDSWPSVFQLQDSGYNVMDQRLLNKTYMATVGWTSVIKTKRGILETGVLLNVLSASISTQLLLTDLKGSATVYPLGYSTQGNYLTSSAVGYARKTIFLFKLPFSVKGEYGFGMSRKTEDSVSNYHHLLYSLNASNQSKLNKHLLGKFDVSYSQHQLEANRLYSILLPYAANSFHNNLNVGFPLKTLNTSYNLAYSWKPQINFGFYAAYNADFSGVSSINYLNQFIQISSDSLTKRILNNFTFLFNTNVYALKSNFHLSATVQYNINTRFIRYRGKLLKNNMPLFFIGTTLTKNWGKIYFINMDADYTNVKFNLPGILQDQVAQSVSNIKASLSQRVALNKHSSIVLDMDFFDKNMFTSRRLSFLLADVEYNFTITKSPLSLAVRLQNITNQTKYSYVDNSPLVQNFFIMPLVKRNIFVSVRYEL